VKTLIIILMTVSLIGISIIQGLWFNNAYEVKEEQFDQSVNEAMRDVVERLNDNDRFVFMNDHLQMEMSNRSTMITSMKNDIRIAAYFGDSMPENSPHFGHPERKISSDGIKVNLRIDSGCTNDTIEHQRVFISELLIGDKDTNHWSFNHESDVEFTSDFGDVFNQLEIEYRRREEPLKYLMGGVKLDTLIEQKLKENGIDLPFEYAVVDNAKDSIVAEYSSVGYKGSGGGKYEKSLFPQDIKEKPESLTIYFPGKDEYVMGSMWTMISGSIIFTLIIVLTYAGAIYYMWKQKRLSDIKTDFINNMTHEFKTPIATISLAVDSMTHPKVMDDHEKVNYFADIIREENKRMNTQVENVLNTALLEKEELKLKLKTVDVHGLINKAMAQMNLVLTKEKGDMSAEMKAEKHLLQADEMHLYNVIVNLLDNAIKYSGGVPNVQISTLSKNNELVMSIKDNGIGMNKETQRKIFDKFFRVTKGNIHDVKGFGIGLSYVKAVVDAHHGSVDVQSELGKGTTMLVHLPIQSNEKG
jgi:two-component system phosphate regulon sensor histidine kinase PhoR